MGKEGGSEGEEERREGEEEMRVGTGTAMNVRRGLCVCGRGGGSFGEGEWREDGMERVERESVEEKRAKRRGWARTFGL